MTAGEAYRPKDAVRSALRLGERPEVRRAHPDALELVVAGTVVARVDRVRGFWRRADGWTPPGAGRDLNYTELVAVGDAHPAAAELVGMFLSARGWAVRGTPARQLLLHEVTWRVQELLGLVTVVGDDGAVPVAILDDDTAPLPAGAEHLTREGNDLPPASGELVTPHELPPRGR